MDWAVTARTTVPHVRTVDADRELATWVLVDATPSMDFGTAEFEKRELAVAAVAAVGFLTAGTGNRLGAHVLGPAAVRRFPARAGRTHLLGMLRTLLAAAARRGRRRAGRRSPTRSTALHRAVPPPRAGGRGRDFLDGLDEDGLGAGRRTGSSRCAGSPPATRCWPCRSPTRASGAAGRRPAHRWSTRRPAGGARCRRPAAGCASGTPRRPRTQQAADHDRDPPGRRRPPSTSDGRRLDRRHRPARARPTPAEPRGPPARPEPPEEPS